MRGRILRTMSSLAGWSMPSNRSLWDILKREQIELHEPKHIMDIWTEFHRDPSKNRVASVLTGPQYLNFAAAAAQHPMFVLPVFRGPNAFETFALQCQMPFILFTSLEDFKRHGASAAPHFVVTHYLELLNSKGIVLVRGDITRPSALDQIQAASLLRHCHEFYLDRGHKRAFVDAFNYRHEQFDFKRMLDSLGHDTSQMGGL